MNIRDQRKHSPSGHENHGVHVCHRCGWTFPNPHPSAKHRRAHKRICGTIEGYKLTDSEEHTHLALSDDEHLSNDDSLNPNATEPLKSMMKTIQINSPEVLESASKIQEGITVHQDSRSEEVSFGLNSMNRSPSDLSPSKAEIPIHELNQDINTQAGDNEIPNSIMCPKEDPEVKRDSEYYGNEVLKVSTEHVIEIANKEFDGQSKLQKTDQIPSDPLTEDGIEQLKQEQKDGYIGTEVKPIEDTEASACGTPSGRHSAKDIMGDGHEKLIETCHMKGEGKEDMHVLYVDNILPVADHPETLIEEDLKDHSSLKSNLPLTLGSDEEISLLADKNVDTKHDVATEVKPVEDKQAGVGSVLVEANSTQDIMDDGHNKLVTDCDVKGEENMHVLHADNILPVADNPETLIEDFKDHRLLKSNLPLTLGSGEEIRPLAEKNMDTKHDITTKAKLAQDKEAGVENIIIETDSAQDIISYGDYKLVEACDMKGEEKEYMHVLDTDNILPVADCPETLKEDFKDHRLLKSNLPLTLGFNEEFGSLAFDKESSSNSCSIRPGGSSDPPAGKNFLKHNIREEDTALAVQEEVETSQVKITSSKDVESNGMEGHSSPSRCELKFQTKYGIEGLEHHFYENESSTVTVSDHSTISNVIPLDTYVDDKTSHLTQSEHVQIDDCGLDKSEDFDRGKNELFEGVAEGKFSDCHMQIAPKTLENFSVSEVDQVTDLARGYDRGHSEAITELSNIPENEGGKAGVAEQKECPVDAKKAVKSGGQLLDQACSNRVPDLTRMDLDESMLGNLQTESIIPVGMVAESNNDVNIEVSRKSLENLIMEESGHMLVDSEVAIKSSGMHNTENGQAGSEMRDICLEKPVVKPSGPLSGDSEYIIASSAAVGHYNSGKSGGRVNAEVCSEPMREEGNDKHTKQQNGVSTVDISVDSNGRTDSLKGNWGSFSVLSTQSDAVVSTDTESVPLGDLLAPEESESAKTQKTKTMPAVRHSDKVDVFEPPSFVTLVETAGGGDKKSASETHAVHNTPSKLGSSQAGWFPSISNVVNEFPGRKKNEERIAKVTNWSAGKQYSPLKHLLGDAKVETKSKSMNSRQMPSSTVKDDDAAAKNTSVSMTTVSSILESEPPSNESTKGDVGKEWKSPARYPIDTEKERKKVKGKPNWVPFICCSSVQELS